ncbi:uncharacterized protein LOC114320797 [Camellia sinensis]|uniref:uncharacterized protein LOC114320797 n=1 Tax=Camellia sinensis TaxID=4442 RepID=UPI001036331A|nr:uncharacterized protein LOC114320797 [Camellia sinensis]
MIRDYESLVEAAAHLETMVQMEKERMRGLRRSQEAQSETRGSKSISFLGLAINEESVFVNPSKIEAIVNWLRPTNVSEVHSFLGLTGYYRKLVKDFSKIAITLTQFTRKGVAYEWTEDRESAF